MGEGLFCRVRQSEPIALDVEFSVCPGEMLAVVGASGSGKTTLLRAIAGLHRPRSGMVSCGGALWMDSGNGVFVAPRVRGIGLVPQHYALFPHLTARRNVMEALLHLQRSDRFGVAGEMLDRVGLSPQAERFPSELSGGQRQRVAIARALAGGPSLLLLDEPFSAIDYPTRRILRELLDEIRSSCAIPIVLVSHDVEDAVRVAGTICFLHNGASIEIGPPQVLLRKVDGAFARWIGDSAMLAHWAGGCDDWTGSSIRMA
ncbi:N/A [soil metagenome]